MQENVICPDEKTEFLRALQNCLAGGLPVLVEGEFLTGEGLPGSALIRESGEWEGCCIRDGDGKLVCLNFSRKSSRTALLQTMETIP